MANPPPATDPLSRAERGGQALPPRPRYIAHLAQLLLAWVCHSIYMASRLFKWAFKHFWNYTWGCRGWQKVVYIVIPCVLGSTVSKGANIPFADAAFLAVSGVTGTGLSPKNLSTLPSAVTFMMLVLSSFGHSQFQSLLYMIPRLVNLRKKMHEFKEYLSTLSPDELAPPPLSPLAFANTNFEGEIQDEKDIATHFISATGHITVVEPVIVRTGIPMTRTNTRHSINTVLSMNTMTSHVRTDHPQDTSALAKAWEYTAHTLERVAPSFYHRLVDAFYRPFVERITGNFTTSPGVTHVDYIPKGVGELVVTGNSNFHLDRLSVKERYQLGLQEESALKFQLIVYPLYQLLWLFVGAAAIYIGCKYSSTVMQKLVDNNVNVLTFALTTSVSGYTGLGITLLDASLGGFEHQHGVLFPAAMVLLAGNGAYPIHLRGFLALCALHKSGPYYRTISFILAHPRRCYTHLFPARETYWLILYLGLFTVTEMILFESLNNTLQAYIQLGSAHVTAGIFQALNARCTGFTLLPLASMAPAQQSVWVAMMYISTFPIRFVIKCTGVYTDMPLFRYFNDQEEEHDPRHPVLHGWLRVLISHLSADIWIVVIGFLATCVTERADLMDESKKWFDMWHLIFETVSASRNLGLSLGVPDDNYSFVGAMSWQGKVVLIIVMVVGKLRTLPSRTDRAIALPNEFEMRQSIEEAKAEII